MSEARKVPENVMLAERLDRSLTLAGVVRPLRQWIARAAYRMNLAPAPEGPVQGSVLYYNGTEWVALPPGTAGQVLTSGGAGANPSWV